MRDVTFSLASFITELALAWQKLAIYQPGHPVREQAVSRAHMVLTGLIAPTGSLGLGISSDGLIGPEEKLVSPPALRLANALYLREVAVLRFEEGIAADELEGLLRALPRGDRYDADRSFSDELEGLGIRNVTIETVDFSALVATDSLDDTGSGNRPKSLWDRMLQRLLNEQRLSAFGDVLQPSEKGSLEGLLEVVQTLLEQYSSGRVRRDSSGESLSPDEAVNALAAMVGGAVGEELLDGVSTETQRSTIRHVTDLLGALPESMREGVLDAAVRELANRDETGIGLASLKGTVSAAKLVGSLRRMRKDRVAFSPRVVSMVESLVLDAGSGMENSDIGQESVGSSLDLRRIFEDFDLRMQGGAAGSNDRVFLNLRKHVPMHARFADLEPYLNTLTEQRLLIEQSETLTDLLQRPIFDGDQTDCIIQRHQESFRSLLVSERFVTATRIVESLIDVTGSLDSTRPIRTAADRCLEGLRDRETLSVLVDCIGSLPPSKLPSVNGLIRRLGPRAVLRLLGDLGEESDLSRRRHIFDLLAGLGSDVVGPAVALLDDGRWYMTRNMLSLLQRVGQGITLEVLQKGLLHNDSRVRLEAVKCLGSLEDDLPRESVDRLLADSDDRVAEAAVSQFGNARLVVAMQPLVELLRRRDPMGRNKALRLRALVALGEIGDPAALPQIEHFFRSWFASVSVEERHAAYESLRLYPREVRQSWVNKGSRAPDSKVRQICRELKVTDQAGQERS